MKHCSKAVLGTAWESVAYPPPESLEDRRRAKKLQQEIESLAGHLWNGPEDVPPDAG